MGFRERFPLLCGRVRCLVLFRPDLLRRLVSATVLLRGAVRNALDIGRAGLVVRFVRNVFEKHG